MDNIKISLEKHTNTNTAMEDTNNNNLDTQLNIEKLFDKKLNNIIEYINRWDEHNKLWDRHLTEWENHNKQWNEHNVRWAWKVEQPEFNEPPEELIADAKRSNEIDEAKSNSHIDKLKTVIVATLLIIDLLILSIIMIYNSVGHERMSDDELYYNNAIGSEVNYYGEDTSILE